jgi:hypothetical protein
MFHKHDKIDFISECPAFNCNNTKKIEWKHNKCQGKQWLNDEGKVICKKCQLNAPIIAWKFKCGKHYDFRDPNKEKICEILSISSSIESGNLKFKAKLLKSVGEMMMKD